MDRVEVEGGRRTVGGRRERIPFSPFFDCDGLFGGLGGDAEEAFTEVGVGRIDEASDCETSKGDGTCVELEGGTGQLGPLSTSMCMYCVCIVCVYMGSPARGISV